MSKVVQYISESFQELKTNVTWTKWDELQNLTIIVAVFTVICALATWAMDESFSKLLASFFNWMKS